MSSTAPRHAPIRPFTYLRTDEGQSWLEKVIVDEPEETPCCPRCRRGTKAHGTRPCGYEDVALGCPNANCAHSRIRG